MNNLSVHLFPLPASLRWHDPDQVQRVKELHRVLFSARLPDSPSR